MNTRLPQGLIALFLAATAALLVAPGAAALATPPPFPGFYAGHIAFEKDVIGIAVTPHPLLRQRVSRIRAFVTDAEPGGDAEWFEGLAVGASVNLRSVGGRAHLRATFYHALGLWSGSIKLRNGITRALVARRLGAGSDLYDITVRAGHYVGNSSQGHRLVADQDGEFVEGTITERSGTARSFRAADLSRLFGYSVEGGQPDRYTVIVQLEGPLFYGRGGDVKRGRPDRNLIALDTSPSAESTPGFFFGKVAFERDVIGVQVDPPDMLGNRRVRAYMSDSEPEPEGDLQWFTTEIAGSEVDVVSVTGDARLRATIADDIIAGTVDLPGGRVRRFFALPAGEGAGIYDVTVDPDGSIAGTSEQGATLEASQQGPWVDVTLTTPDGQSFSTRRIDLTRGLRYPTLGNQPDSYVAIIAPRGRYIFGRSGDVRTGSGGLNIIGLNACD